MIEVLFYARGGQGAVTAAHLLAEAAFRAGKRVQAQPFFGAERRGAPVYAITRISDEEILTRRRSAIPDILVLLDPTLVGRGQLVAREWVIANTKLECEELARVYPTVSKVATADLTKLVTELGLVVAGFPVINTAILGSLVKATHIVELSHVIDAVKLRWRGELGKKNSEAVKRAYHETVVKAVRK